MARKRCSDEDNLKLLRVIELKLAEGGDVHVACRTVGLSEAILRQLAPSQLSELRDLDKESARRIHDVRSS